MNRRLLVWRSLRFYWRTHVGVAIGAAIGAAVLVGALLVGDSVRGSLRDQALLRIGRIDSALVVGDRFVRAALADALGPDVAPVLRLDGLASTADGSHRASDVQVLGVDGRFAGLAETPGGLRPASGAVLLNERLARQLDVIGGQEIIIRLERPSAMPRDMVLAVNEDLSLALRVTVAGTMPDAALGRFGLEANQVAPYNAFVDLEWLAGQLDLSRRSNLLLVAGATVDGADRALRASWTLADAELDAVRRPELGVVDLVSRRVFIDEPVGRAAAAAAPEATGILTYFVNELRCGPRSTPYSMVSAVGPLGAPSDADRGAEGEEGLGTWSVAALVPQDLGDDEIVINRWLADDLGASPGDEIEITYYVLGESRRLVEKTSSFLVRSVVDLAGAAADRTLMPEFPGLSDAENCRDWEPGIPVDLDRIRDVDETYWDEYGGTPKAYVALEAGRRMWGNRFGALTAVRLDAGAAGAALATLRRDLDPASVGLFFQDVRGPALAASATSTDFGGLFLGLSLFLIVSSLLLVALLFALGVDQRATEIGALLAVGFRPRDVRRLFVGEGAVIALVGSVAGAALGLGYTRLVLLGLETIWRGAIGATSIGFHVRASSVAIGTAIAFVTALGAIWITARRQVRRPAVSLLAGGGDEVAGAGSGARGGAAAAGAGGASGAPGRARVSVAVAAVCTVGAIAIVIMTGADRGPAAAGAFFGAGGLLLIAAIASSRAALVRIGRSSDRARLTVAGLGVRNGVRRAGRSLAVVTLVACGTFLVTSVGANRLDAGFGAERRDSGTGGFALYARSTIPVPQNLDTTAGRASFGLDDADLAGVAVVPMRLRAGDDASCLNLSLSRQPRLLGVDPAALAERGAFSFARTLDDAADRNPWMQLEDADATADDRVVPAIGDVASLMWAMHKAVGDTLEYRDERGRPFTVKIVGAIANSILQGNLLIDERRFEELFPSESGYRVFLIDAPGDRAPAASALLSRQMADVGLEVTSAAARLAEFNAVQNTYLAIFQVLGGLGLLLGSAGLGMVVLRNVMERRGELAVLRAIGFRTGTLRLLVLSEHGMLLALGLAGGTVSAVVAVLPALRAPGADLPLASTALLVAAIGGSGLLWAWFATVWGLRGPLLGALRNE